MDEKEQKETHYRVKSISNAQLRERIYALSKEKLLEFAYELSKAYYKQEKRIETLQDELEKLQKRIENLQKPKKPADKYAGYPMKKDYIAKLKFILERNKRAMSFEEIVEEFFQLESDLNERWRNPNKSISKIISRACRFGTILRSKAYGNHGYFTYNVS